MAYNAKFIFICKKNVVVVLCCNVWVACIGTVLPPFRLILLFCWLLFSFYALEYFLRKLMHQTYVSLPGWRGVMNFVWFLSRNSFLSALPGERDLFTFCSKRRKVLKHQQGYYCMEESVLSDLCHQKRYIICCTTARTARIHHHQSLYITTLARVVT